MKRFRAICLLPGIVRDILTEHEIIAPDLETARQKAYEVCKRAGGSLYDIFEVGEVSKDELEGLI